MPPHHSRYVPTFSFASRVSPVTARQDKIETDYGDWHVFAFDNDLWGYFANLGEPCTPSMDLPSAPIASAPAFRLFNSPSGTDPTTPRLDIAAGGQGSVRRPNAPLISGHLQVRRIAVPASAQTGREIDGRRLRARLFLNPTRFVHHQIMPRHLPSPPEDWDLGAPSFLTRRRLLSTSLEASLDGNDNVLLTTQSLSFGRPEAWPIHLDRYWSITQSVLNDCIIHAGLHFETTPFLNLRRVQTYWEFGATDPTAVVRSLVDPLNALGHRLTTRSYPGGLVETERDNNCLSIRVRLRSGVILRVYAKTTRRIRFEIEHDLIKNARPLPQQRHTTNDPGQLLEWLDHLAEDASREVNWVLGILESLPSRGFSWVRSYHLVRRIVDIVGENGKVGAILSLLVNNGCIRLGPNDPLRPSVRDLVDANVLERVAPRRQSFVVATRYRHALTELGSAVHAAA